MPTLAQIRERNRRQSPHAYLIFLEVALPTGRTLRLARDPQSWVWPRGDAVTANLTTPGSALTYTLASAGSLTFSVLSPDDSWQGTIALERQTAPDAWFEVATFARRTEDTLLAQPAGTYRLVARPGFSGTARAILGGPTTHLWQAMAFEHDEWKEGEGARRATATITISNASGLPAHYVEELEDWRKQHGRASCKARLLVVSTGLMDDPEPTYQLSLVDVGISIPAPMDKVHFVLGTANTMARMVPRRRMMRDSCSWQRTTECPHVANCNHTLTRCREITLTLDAARMEYFGGFPFLGKGALYG